MWDILSSVLHDIAYWVFDKILTAISIAISAIDVSGFVGDVTGLWGSLPPQLIYLIHQLGVPAALDIFSAALAIRLTLKLVPFIHW